MVRTCGRKDNTPAGCSKRPDFSPTQPWRAETRLSAGKAAASDLKMVIPSLLAYVTLRMARMSPSLRALSAALSILSTLSLREWPRLPFTARIERAQCHRARSASKKGTWPLPSLLADFFSSLRGKRLISHRQIEPSQHRGGQRELRLHLDARRH